MAALKKLWIGVLVILVLAIMAPVARGDDVMSWRVRAFKAEWTSVASSADGTTLYAAADYIYRSTDSGATWDITGADGLGWISIVSSSDGKKLAAVTNSESEDGGRIYTSSDSGATWTVRDNAGYHFWVAIASSSDGKKLLAATTGETDVGDGYIYTSADSGATWTKRNDAGDRFWVAVASSSDGKKLVAASNDWVDSR